VNKEALAEALDASPSDVLGAIETLSQKLDHQSALQVVEIAGGYQLATRPVLAEVVTRFLKPQKQRLSRSVMEVLAIIAYRQPITLAEIEMIRGVQSDYGVRSLLERRLIKVSGKRMTPGRPWLYATTQQFLHQFNLRQLSDLPELTIDLKEAAHALGLPKNEDVQLPGLIDEES